jgi:3-isopropylmalate/(R)-2-methylmalate dehydratase large subunit
MAGLTVAEKILSRRSGKTVVADELVIATVDGVMASDTTAPLAIRAFEAMGGKRPWDSTKVFFVIDHAAPAPNERIADLHQLMRDFAGRHGVVLYDVGEGICHQLMIEKGHVKAGDLFLGADSHTCTYGSLGAFSAGVGSTDLAAVMLTGRVWLRVPRTIKLVISGRLLPGVGAKDLALAMIGRLGVNGATYRNIEFHGEALKELSLASRMTLANMAVEMGAKACFVNPDGLPLAAGLDLEALMPDADAVYETVIDLDAGELQHQVACPHGPDQVVTIDRVAGTPISYGFIGSCVNGRLEDLESAAAVLRGHQVASGVRLIIGPASRQVYIEAVRNGTVEALLTAGAVFIPPGCGPCVGTHNGVPGQGEKVISTANRNFKGRMGNPNAEIYLASPAVVAASVLRGVISAPDVLDRSDGPG